MQGAGATRHGKPTSARSINAAGHFTRNGKEVAEGRAYAGAAVCVRARDAWQRWYAAAPRAGEGRRGGTKHGTAPRPPQGAELAACRVGCCSSRANSNSACVAKTICDIYLCVAKKMLDMKV